MADTARKTEEEKKEHFDSEEVLEEKIQVLAKLILKSKHFIAFTGAGISTACGIPDFRSGVNTVLKTGPGAWEKKALNIKDEKPNRHVIEMGKAIPSFTHMTLVALEETGLLQYLVSQNTDGLHVRSGLNTDHLAELHGNRCLEKCKNCDCKFLRDFRTRQAEKVHDHQTSRKCEKCNGVLYDSIINFGQSLPEYELTRSLEEANKADLCLALGSSLTVVPAAHIPKEVGKKGKLIIVNLQETPLDSYAFMRINGLCQDVMKKLALKLDLKIKEFILRRLIHFKINKQEHLQFRGIDKNGVPFSFFKKVMVEFDKGYETLKGEPYKISLKGKQFAKVTFSFYRYLNEPDYELILKEQREGILQIDFDPKRGQWISTKWLDL